MESVIFQEQSANRCRPSRTVGHKVHTHAYCHSLIAFLMVEMVYLPWRKEENGSWTHVIFLKVHRMMPLTFLKPKNFIERVHVRLAVVHLAFLQEVWESDDTEAVSLRCVAHGVVHFV